MTYAHAHLGPFVCDFLYLYQSVTEQLTASRQTSAIQTCIPFLPYIYEYSVHGTGTRRAFFYLASGVMMQCCKLPSSYFARQNKDTALSRNGSDCKHDDGHHDNDVISSDGAFES